MSRRWRYPRSRRGITFQVPQTAPLIPAYREQAGPRPRFATRLRRGSFYAVPPQGVQPAPTPRRRTLPAATRRGRFWALVPAPVIVAPPRPPDGIGHDRPRPSPPRRGRFTTAPQPAVQPASPGRTRSRWLPAVRRGRFLSVPPPPVVATAPAFVPQVLARRRLNLAVVRHTRYLTVPPAPIAPTAPAFVPQPPVRRRPAPPNTRRGRFLFVPPTVAPTPPPWVPPILSAHRPIARLARRGRFIGCPAEGPRPPQRTQRRPYGLPTRRGERFDPPWTATPPPASTWPPDRIGSHRRSIPPVRRRPARTPPWPQIAQAPPSIVPTLVRTRRRLVRPKRGCFLQWPIYQATQPELPDLSAIEAVRARILAAEAITGRCNTTETPAGRGSATETVTGRASAAETVLGRIET